MRAKRAKRARRATQVTALLAAAAMPFGITGSLRQDTWVKAFAVEKANLVATGRNPYFVLEPGHIAIYDHADEHLVITVSDSTRVVDGVTTRVVVERESKDGKLVEVSRNYFAIDTKTNDVYYFGESVDMYQGGRVVNHEGSWLAGVDGARFGLMMPAKPTSGMKHYQEIAEGTAMDRAAVVGMNETVLTPAGIFKDCLKVEETTPLEPGAREYKYYAPGVGLVQDGDLKLTRRLRLVQR